MHHEPSDDPRRLAPEESAAYTVELRARSAARAQRAADLAAATAEHDALAARIRRDHALGRAVLAEDRAALGTLRARIRRLRPHTLRWRVTLAGAHTVDVETRDKSDGWDESTTCVVGAHAEIARRALKSTAPAGTTCHETECSHYEPGWRDREADHRAAVERLCDANGWEGATIERAGERWEP